MRTELRARSMRAGAAVLGGSLAVAALAVWGDDDPAIPDVEAFDEVDEASDLPDQDEGWAGVRRAHRVQQAAWVRDVCVPATDDAEACTAYATSEAWPWNSDDPLADIAATYEDCGRWAATSDERDFCEALASQPEG